MVQVNDDKLQFFPKSQALINNDCLLNLRYFKPLKTNVAFIFIQNSLSTKL
jgi:hypothetical protein